MTTTTSTAATQGKPKQSSLGYDIGEIQKIRGFVEDLLLKYFPSLAQAPNALYVIMAVIGFESGWRLLCRRGLLYSSIHDGSYNSSSFNLRGGAREYWNNSSIQHLVRSPGVSPTTIDNIKQGFVAHGLSAIMGYYLVANTTPHQRLFKSYRNVVSDLGLSVNPGEPITSLFQANDDLAKKRSIAAGMVHIENDYVRLSKHNSPSNALTIAIGSYLGSPKTADKNGMTPEQRIRDVLSGSKPVNRVLQIAGITFDGVAFANNSQSIAATSTPTASNDTTRVASTTSTGKSSPGCPTT